MTREDAVAFAWKLVGTELCTGANADETACYRISPVVAAYLEGAIGADAASAHWARLHAKGNEKLARFLIEAGQALLPEAKEGV